MAGEVFIKAELTWLQEPQSCLGNWKQSKQKLKSTSQPVEFLFCLHTLANRTEKLFDRTSSKQDFESHAHRWRRLLSEDGQLKPCIVFLVCVHPVQYIWQTTQVEETTSKA